MSETADQDERDDYRTKLAAALRTLTAAAATIARQDERIAELEAELEPGPKVTDTVQLVIPRGPMLDGLKQMLSHHGCVMAGPIPLEREPIPTYVLQPRIPADPTDGSET